MILNEFLTADFWFNPRPEPIDHHGQIILVAAASIMMIFTFFVALRAYPEKLTIYRSVLLRLISFCVVNTIIIVYWLIVNNQIIPILRARAWYILCVIEVVLWIIVIIKSRRQQLKRHENLSKEAEIKKYIP